MAKIINNVVDKNTMRNIQSRTLHELADILVKSFGPNGSNTCIKRENALSRYTKDGHTIIGAMHYNGIIEQSIKDDVESITRHIVKTVGDGTTSAVILSSLIFDSIVELENEFRVQPATLVKILNKMSSNIQDKIKESAHEITLQDVYDIAMISTNGNEEISNYLLQIYQDFGMNVFIDVTPSTSNQTMVKSYDGMTLNTGYCDSCYVNNTKNNTSEIDHPNVYFFEHPIDTREMGVYLDAILHDNIINACNKNDPNLLVPTVIFAPTISQDMSGIMDQLISIMAQTPVQNRLPICIITGYHEPTQLADLAKMCGAKMIRKYIDAKIYEEDVKNGKAPTPQNIHAWAGTADKIVSYSDKTLFIRPSAMFNADGSYSVVYDNMLAFLKAEIEKESGDGGDINALATLKRRLHSLESNMVEMFVGGITQADRDAIRDLVEDAVLNLRSAAANGVGFAANVSAMRCINEFSKNYLFDSEIEMRVYEAIKNAYHKLVEILFEPEDITPEKVCADMDGTIRVYNIREQGWNTNVKSSIMSDITILSTVTRIIGIMATCNQFIVPTAGHNIYID